MAKKPAKTEDTSVEPTPEAPSVKPATTVTTVTMTDGRIVEFAGKRQVLKTLVSASNEQPQVRFDCVNGETRLFTVPAADIGQYAARGASHFIGDSYAGLATIDDIVLQIDKVIDQLYEGKFSADREKGEGAGASLLVQAIVRVTGKDRESVRKTLDAMTKEQKSALRTQNVRVVEALAAIATEKAQEASAKAGTSAEDMLANF